MSELTSELRVLETDAVSYLARVPRVSSLLETTSLNDADLQATLRVVRAAQRSLDGVVVQLGMRANVLAADGRSAPAEEAVRDAGAVSARQARKEAKRAETAEALPQVREAIVSGQVSGEHIDAFARLTAELSDDQQRRLDHDQVMVEAAALPVETFERYLRRIVQQLTKDHGGREETTAKQAASALRHWFDHEAGMGKLFATLDPELYERITTAIEQQSAAMATKSGETKNANLAARALGDVVSNSGDAGGAGRRAPSITVVVDHRTFADGPHAETICQTEGGHHISPESVARMCCDAVVRRVALDRRGVPINVGRKHRTATDAQWAALKAVYATCAWDGCESPIGWCQAHHIREWENGGKTDLQNLVPLCSTHHHRVHEGQWRLKLNPDRALQTFRPDGQEGPATPTPMRC